MFPYTSTPKVPFVFDFEKPAPNISTIGVCFSAKTNGISFVKRALALCVSLEFGSIGFGYPVAATTDNMSSVQMTTVYADLFILKFANLNYKCSLKIVIYLYSM